MAKWMDVVKGVAPTLASLLPGPFGPMAHKVIADALGATDSKPQTLEAKLQTVTADDLLKIKAAESTLIETLGAQGIELEKIAAGDRADARAMQVSTRSQTPPVLAGLAVALVAAMIWTLATKKIPDPNVQAFSILLGYVGANLGSVYNYYFGSSASSRGKDEALAKAATS